MTSVPDIAPAAFARAGAVADAVLYEGYLLYPYRQSSPKNKVRWQFGVVAPRPWIEAQGPPAATVAGSAESWHQQAECLLEAGARTRVHVRVRFLQVQAKDVERRTTGSGDAARYAAAASLDIDGRLHIAFDEAVAHEVDFAGTVAELETGLRRVVEIAGAEEVTPIADADGCERGRLVRRRWPLSAVVSASAESASTPFPLWRLRIRTENTSEDAGAGDSREAALHYSLVAAHCLIAADAGAFMSLLDPPAWASAAAQECRNLHVFPVLAGEPSSTDVMLASPIILYDHPQIAPESPGDLFDATEIDEILSLRTLTLTDAEKREVRATDPRAAAIVDRVDDMPPEMLERLHGAIRSLQPVTRRTAPEPGKGPRDKPAEWWEPGADAALSPHTDSIDVSGVAISRGSIVRLHPRGRGADAYDMFLAGRLARVSGIFLDVEGAWHVAVTLRDDPASDIHDWYGRYLYFAPDEVEPQSGAGEDA